MANPPLTTTQRIWGVFNAQNGALVGFSTSGEAAYQSVLGSTTVAINFPALRLTLSSQNLYAFVIGSAAPGDGGGGDYFVNASSTQGAWLSGSMSGNTLTVSQLFNGTIANGLTLNRGDTGASIGTITGGSGNTWTCSGSANIQGPIIFTCDNSSTFVVGADGARWNLSGLILASLPSNLVPNVDNTFNLGSASFRWAGLWAVNATLNSATIGALTATSTTTTTLSVSGTVSTGLIPAVNNSVNLGSASFSWANLYLGPNDAPVLDATSGNIGYYAKTAAETAAIAAATAASTPSPMTVANIWVPSHVATGYIYPERYGTITPGTDCSLTLWFAQLVQQQTGAPIFLSGKNYTGAMNFAYSNASIIGSGSAATTITLPTTTVAITSVSVTSNFVTVTCAAPHNLWVGKAIRITGNTYNSPNAGVDVALVVTSITSSTVFVCQQLSTPIANGTGTGGSVMASNCVDIGQTYHGNAASAFTGFTARGLTMLGQRSIRAAPESDTTDAGMLSCAFSQLNITDARAVNCWNAGLNFDINSNYGYIQGYVENCGTAATTGVGFDINSSKFLELDIIANNCPVAGCRILDNCWGIIARFTVNNAGTIGFIGQNQTVNQSYACDVKATIVGGCTFAGVQISNNFRSSLFDLSIQGVTGVGVQEIFFASNQPTGNRYKVCTNNSQQQGVIIGGNGGTWDVTSYLDGRAGAAGSEWAVQIDGQQNNVLVNVTDSAVAQVRGLLLTANSVGNYIAAFSHNTLVSNLSDLGTSNRFAPITFEVSFSGTFNVGAGGFVSQTAAVTGVAFGDQILVAWPSNPQGIVVFGNVQSAGNVTVTAYNPTGGALNFGAITLTLRIIKA